MRIAICFSGQAERLAFERTSHQHYFLQNQLAKYQGYSQADLFFSHWEGTENKDTLLGYLQRVLPVTMKGSYTVAGIEFTPAPTIVSKYEQKDCWRPEVNFVPMLSMFAGIKNADLLRQQYERYHDFTYDIVFRARGDVNVIGDYDLLRYKQILDANPNSVLLPQNQHHPSLWNEQGGMLCDHWLAATSGTMSKLTTLTDHVDEYFDAGCRVHPESLMWWHIVNGIKADYNFQNFKHIIRGYDTP